MPGWKKNIPICLQAEPERGKPPLLALLHPQSIPPFSVIINRLSELPQLKVLPEELRRPCCSPVVAGGEEQPGADRCFISPEKVFLASEQSQDGSKK
ncbi:hypothetical protein DUI87_12776 [Hirundo rustica rustica]|uniref:Uncharacterized protein n=1 Tax=Hirundo rustica rustica TaxID=333673 RepID=A0A3M0K9X5_HIRRU|nr:hypothetical protein DUI87_12776 [Hirundo rustica rustica]